MPLDVYNLIVLVDSNVCVAYYETQRGLIRIHHKNGKQLLAIMRGDQHARIREERRV